MARLSGDCLLCGTVKEVVESGGLRETREGCGVNAGVGIEEALLY